MTKITYIPGEIANAAIDEHGNRKPVTRTQHIFDDAKGKKQSEINADVDNGLADRYTKAETYNKTQLDNMITTPEIAYKDYDTYADMVAETVHPVGAIYRVANYDGTQAVTNKYAEYSWDGTQYKLMAVKDHGIDDGIHPGSQLLAKSGDVYKSEGKIQGEVNYYNGSNYQFDELVTVTGDSYRKTISVFYKQGSILKYKLIAPGGKSGGYLSVTIPEISYQKNSFFGAEYSVECTADISEVRVWIAKGQFNADGTLSVKLSNQGDVYKHIDTETEARILADTTLQNNIDAEVTEREAEINHFNGSNYTFDVPIVISESDFAKFVSVSYKRGEIIKLKLSSENATRAAYLSVTIGTFFSKNVFFDTIETIECEEDVKSIRIWVAKSQFTADTTLQIFVSNQGEINEELDRRIVFTPKSGGRSSVIGKCPKTIEFSPGFMCLSPSVAPASDSDRDSHLHRYNWMNFIQENLPYPTLRMSAFSWSSNRAASFGCLKDIIISAHDVGLTGENFIFGLTPLHSDFSSGDNEGEEPELTDTFKNTLDELITMFNGSTNIGTEENPVTFKAKYFELGNELDYFNNGVRHYSPGTTDSQVYYYWQYVYTRIKELNPDAVILSNGYYYFGRNTLNPKMIEYMNHQYSNGKYVYDYFDIFNFHYYHTDVAPELIIETIKNYSKTYGSIGKKAWITELGCGETSEIQAYRLPILCLLSLGLGIERLIIYKLFNYFGSTNPQKALISSYTYKDTEPVNVENVVGEGYYALKFFKEICGQGTERPVISRRLDVYFANWYSTRYGNVYAVWSLKDGISAKIETTSIDQPRCVLYNYKGEIINTLSSDNILQINKNITYIVGCDSLNIINIFEN